MVLGTMSYNSGAEILVSSSHQGDRWEGRIPRSGIFGKGGEAATGGVYQQGQVKAQAIFGQAEGQSDFSSS
jgi:hypothetical protein